MIFWVFLIHILQFALSPYPSQKNIPILIFFTGFCTQSLKKAAANQSWANSGGQQGALQVQRIIRKHSKCLLLCGCYNLLPNAEIPRSGAAQTAYQNVNNSLILTTVFSRCNRIFLFIISYIITLQWKTRIFVQVKTLKSSTWLRSFSNASSNQESYSDSTAICCNV